ncbi:MAG: DUF4279 domain-containing protein [Spirochaetales bacterium]|nr:DUF4279 domain-containing protein [Leptospiraceae bacterium]MCP5481693.1 DUF4279 domain-containing protein [Spirochaetales bacterium]
MQTEAEQESGGRGPAPHYSGWVVFAVTGRHLEPEDVTRRLGTEPDRVVLAAAERDAVWQINSTLPAQSNIEEHLWELMNRLLPMRHELRRLARDWRVEFFCAVESLRGTVQRIDLSPRLLLFIGHLGAHLAWEFSDHPAEPDHE